MNDWLMFGLGIAASLGVNELCDVSPWLAGKLIPRAARLWTRDLDRREVYTEAWLAIINERPGKLFKLGTALTFLGGGLGRHVADRVRGVVGQFFNRLREDFAEGAADDTRDPGRLDKVAIVLGRFAGYAVGSTENVIELAFEHLVTALTYLAAILQRIGSVVSNWLWALIAFSANWARRPSAKRHR